MSIALGAAPVADCPAFDRNDDDEVGVFELINADSNALDSCPAPSDGLASTTPSGG